LFEEEEIVEKEVLIENSVVQEEIEKWV